MPRTHQLRRLLRGGAGGAGAVAPDGGRGGWEPPTVACAGVAKRGPGWRGDDGWVPGGGAGNVPPNDAGAGLAAVCPCAIAAEGGPG